MWNIITLRLRWCPWQLTVQGALKHFGYRPFPETLFDIYNANGRAVAQADFPLQRPVLDPRLGHVGFAGNKKWRWARFSASTSGFPLPILILPTAPHSSSSIIRGWYHRPVSGRRTKWIQSHPNLKKKNYTTLYKQDLFSTSIRSIKKQEIVWRTNRVISFDATSTAWKTKQKN
jgi:hypothetical protein